MQDHAGNISGHWPTFREQYLYAVAFEFSQASESRSVAPVSLMGIEISTTCP